jgi:hypothetical protein
MAANDNFESYGVPACHTPRKGGIRGQKETLRVRAQQCPPISLSVLGLLVGAVEPSDEFPERSYNEWRRPPFVPFRAQEFLKQQA